MTSRRYPIGAEVLAGGTHFRVWAPQCKRVAVVEMDGQGQDTGRPVVLDREPGGYHSGLGSGFGDGSWYGFRLDGQDKIYPDPASRFQPWGPHAASQVVDAKKYSWKDGSFPGVPERGRVLYEMHIGTFTPEGTYAAAARELEELSRLGITTLELMPLAEFPGRFGWGYDGVDLWAPSHLYGTPDELRHFIDSAHQHGLSVLLDVVYNHLGPDGNYLKCFSKDYFTDRYKNEWGEPLNFDGKHSGPVREFFINNARYWIEEYHFDGLRLDATQSMFDASERHIVADVVAATREAGRAHRRRVFVVAENEPQHARLVRPVAEGGYGGDALWNDDFHHTARVALTGRREAYYQDYRGTPQELISAIKRGYLYQGQYYSWQQQTRGRSALDLEARHFITYLQNHDQVANSLDGARCDRLTSPALLRALTSLWLLAPPTPMLFQGQEFAASAPFLYFADHTAELASLVDRGRAEFLAQFPSVAAAVERVQLAPAAASATFERCKLDLSERTKHQAWYDLHRDLLALRKADVAFGQERSDRIEGAVLSEKAFVLRVFCDAGDRLVLVNFGPDLELSPCPEPLLAPPPDMRWQLILSSEDPKYGGQGFGLPNGEGQWQATAQSTTVFSAVPQVRGRGGAETERVDSSGDST